MGMTYQAFAKLIYADSKEQKYRCLQRDSEEERWMKNKNY